MREPLRDKGRLERHHLVHGYYQVNPQDVWDVIQNDLRPLRQQVESYINETDWSAWEK